MLALEIKSVDEVLPVISDVHRALIDYPKLPSGYQGLNVVSNWVNKMKAMKASDSLSDEDARQLKFDLDSSMQ